MKFKYFIIAISFSYYVLISRYLFQWIALQQLIMQLLNMFASCDQNVNIEAQNVE